MILANIIPTFITYSAQATINCPSGQSGETGGCNGGTGLPKVTASNANAQAIFQVVFGIMGAIAVIVIIISAIQLVTSQGDPQAVGKARDTIIYAAVGLAIALSAEVLVSFVITSL
jgi:hypothetical protein